MQRREFMTIVGGAIAGWPVLAKSQKRTTPTIGYLESGSETSPSIAFKGGLNESGFVEAQNVLIEYRAAQTQYERLPALATDIVGRQVTVIVASGAVVAPLAARAATKTIPIVFLIGANPVRAASSRALTDQKEILLALHFSAES